MPDLIIDGRPIYVEKGGSVIEAARGPLAENGLAVSQIVTGHGDEIGVTTVLMHSSGEWLSSTVSLPLQKEAGKSLAQAAGYVTATWLQATVAHAPPAIRAESAAWFSSTGLPAGSGSRMMFKALIAFGFRCVAAPVHNR